jgi:hypothetical protein
LSSILKMFSHLVGVRAVSRSGRIAEASFCSGNEEREMEKIVVSNYSVIRNSFSFYSLSVFYENSCGFLLTSQTSYRYVHPIL